MNINITRLTKLGKHAVFKPIFMGNYLNTRASNANLYAYLLQIFDIFEKKPLYLLLVLLAESDFWAQDILGILDTKVIFSRV